MSTETENTFVVAICAATGNQGKEVIQRFQEINETLSKGAKKFHCVALTRNASSEKARNIGKLPNVTVAETDYLSVESLMSVLQNADALYLNYAMVENVADIEKSIIDTAIESGVKHIVYASTAGEKNQGVPHWKSSLMTDEYLEKCLSEARKHGKDFTYHLVQLAHFNENILPGSFFPPNNGKITYPWRSDAQFATSSLRDAARVACKLFVEPQKLNNGGTIDAVTELVSVDNIAKSLSKATGDKIRAKKGPWIFTTFGHWFGWEASAILTMAEYIDTHGFVKDLSLTDMADFLQEEIEAGEPLETMEIFARRHFGKGQQTSSGFNLC